MRSSSFGSIFPVIASVTSFTETVTKTREPGPFESSSSRVFARKPSTSRFRCGVELYWSDALHAVVVGGDQALGRDERGGAAAERDDRAHRLAGEVGEGRGVALEAHRLELRGEVGDLLRHPHALVGGEGRAATRARRRGQRGCGGGLHEVSWSSARAGGPASIARTAPLRRGWSDALDRDGRFAGPARSLECAQAPGRPPPARGREASHDTSTKDPAGRRRASSCSGSLLPVSNLLVGPPEGHGSRRRQPKDAADREGRPRPRARAARAATWPA